MPDSQFVQRIPNDAFYLVPARNYATLGRWPSTASSPPPASISSGATSSPAQCLPPHHPRRRLAPPGGLPRLAAWFAARTASRLFGPGALFGVALIFLSASCLPQATWLTETSFVILASAAMLFLLCRETITFTPAVTTSSLLLGFGAMMVRSDTGLLAFVLFAMHAIGPAVLSADELTPAHVGHFELILADEPIARALRPLIKSRQSAGEEIRPALIAIVPAPYIPSAGGVESDTFDAVLALPESPASLRAQLRIALHAYRAFARRYQSALEELHLNRNIFESVSSGISVADTQLPDMPLIYVNPAFEVMTSYSPEEVVGKNCRFLQQDDKDQSGLTLIREALVRTRETVTVVRNYRKDGSSFWNELSISHPEPRRRAHPLRRHPERCDGTRRI